ncbi:MAG: glycine dehydrogenase (aminomethyl-transferring) [Spirochaetes bacterium GWD1_27_9]|nr:MAG: glycine dehydrogenase (aminomethyl-transferring) [Spirochaetes bacterium GWB1_27_13]OHD26000.1 MAG: glycine dehydrogenase (aminomethyl-transferring) [Spirochaetes bacterium GWC1_27_15]OHD32319.1 MAG: glycine dehydrogenase (aminomethyl-transferring) [Spirochaetes bacterium GWD1_27_9]
MKDKNIIFEKSNNCISSYSFNIEKNEKDILNNIPQSLLNDNLSFMPDVSEGDVARHFIRLSNRNYGVDTGFYPLGSCTMKYNPKINEKVAGNPDFANIHPYSSTERVQGVLEVLYKCREALVEITGMDEIDLSPCAGAHGELTGLYIIKAYFKNKKEERPIILVPDSAHGTNPASASVAGFKVVSVKSDADGFVDIDDLKQKVSKDVACFMLTNPNTLGLYEKNLDQIVKICHDLDIQLYYDGANLNAILGISKPGETGFDVVHLNLHKSFATPHGGGGPGAGPVGVKKHLIDFLPGENVVYKNNKYSLEKRGSLSIGKVRSFYANFSVVLKSYVYIVSLGKEGFSKLGLLALLNANYLGVLLKEYFDIATKPHIMHEFVISLQKECDETHLTVMDFAKRILDYGYHAPTVSFPLIVHSCLMVEPTETESKETLDKFAEILIKILEESKTNPDLLKNSPVNTPIKRVDDVMAARTPVLKYSKDE